MRGLALAEQGGRALLIRGRVSFQSSCLAELPCRAHADDAREARLERRRRRREQTRRLKGFSEGGPEYFWEAAAESDEATASEENAMWRHLLRHSHSAGAKARVRRAWRQWEEEQEADNGAGFEQNASAGAGPWWQGDHETSWTFHSKTTAEERERQEREQAGASHPRFRERQQWGWWQQRASTPPPRRYGRDVLASLEALGLPAQPPALPTLVDLKAAFRRSAMKHHPDRHAADPVAAAAAEKRFKEVQAAFQLLMTMVAPS